jgi:hypothetical protein
LTSIVNLNPKTTNSGGLATLANGLEQVLPRALQPATQQAWLTTMCSQSHRSFMEDIRHEIANPNYYSMGQKKETANGQFPKFWSGYALPYDEL